MTTVIEAKVVQADRDRAASIASLVVINEFRFRRGDYDDHPLVQTLASHRLAALEEAAKVAEHTGRVFGEKPPGGERGTNIVWDTAQRISFAIRNLTNPSREGEG